MKFGFRNTLTFLGGLLKSSRGLLVLGALMLLLTNAAALAVPYMLKLSIDALSSLEAEVSGLDKVYGYVGILAVAAVLQAIFRVISRMSIFFAGRNLEYELRNRLFGKLQKLPFAFYDMHESGDIISRCTNDLSSVRLLAGPGILNIINTVMLYIAVIAIAGSINPTLTVASLAPYPLVFLIVWHYGKKIHDRSLDVQEQLGTLSTRIQDNIAGQAIVKSYNMGEAQARDFNRDNDRYYDANTRLITVRGAIFSMVGIIGGIGGLVVILVGGRMVIEGVITLGDLVAFMAYLALLAWPTFAIGWIIGVWQRGIAALGRIRAILDSEELPVVEQPCESAGSEFRGKLELRNLRFDYGELYPDKPFGTGKLEDISLTIPAGGSLGITGKVGSGKSTLVHIISGILPVQRGMVFIDGCDINDIPLPRLRKNLAIAGQEAFLFSRSIGENIAFGLQELDLDRVVSSARIAGLHGDVEGFSRGYDTVVGERGVALSGGQRGRAALARALALDPGLLILDDSFAAVDTNTEGEILAELRAFMDGRTTIMIAHRLSTLRFVDKIAVLDDGRLAEYGSHEELLEAGGLYAQLHTRQQLKAELEEMAT